MAIVGDTYTLDVPGEDGQSFTFRKLTAGELREADDRGTELSLKTLKFMPDNITARAMERQRDADGEARRLAQFRGHDPEALVKFGVVGWTYQRTCELPGCDHMNSGKGLSDPGCCDALKARLEAATTDWAARVIYEDNVRPEGEAPSSDGSSHRQVESPESLLQPTSSSLQE